MPTMGIKVIISKSRQEMKRKPETPILTWLGGGCCVEVCCFLTMKGVVVAILVFQSQSSEGCL